MPLPERRVAVGKQKRYDKQFKVQAARLVTEHGYSFKDAAERLGISIWTLRDWVKKLRGTGELPAETATGTVGDEMRALRDENRRLRLENEILKKATAYFARDSL